MTNAQIISHRDNEYCKGVRRNALITTRNMEDELKQYFRNEKLNSNEAYTTLLIQIEHDFISNVAAVDAVADEIIDACLHGREVDLRAIGTEKGL